MEKEALELLAKELNVQLDDIEATDDYYDEVAVVDGNKVYMVLTKEDAYRKAVESIEDSYDEMGLEAFTPSFQGWILDNALKETEWDEVIDEEIRNNYQNLSDEEIIEEASKKGMFDKLDLDKDHISEEDISTLRDELAEDEFYKVKPEYYNIWVKNNIDRFTLKDMIKANKYFVDIDKVANKAIELDGIGHFLASYDGEEIYLGDGYRAYRID